MPDVVRGSAVLLAALLATACVTPPGYAPGIACVTPVVTVTDEFEGARRGRCTVIDNDHLQLQIAPEDEPPINNSPWYAFRVAPHAEPVQITLAYEHGRHRYVPKLSDHGRHWSTLDESRVDRSDDGRAATLTLPPRSQEYFVAAQELLPPSVYEDWMRRLVATGNVNRTLLGRSLLGREIHRLDDSDRSDDGGSALLIVGRQHPPEVSGAFAFMAFAETLFGQSELAVEFRNRFRVIAVPLLNPDGVIAGHWRHNLGGTDLNRDWGPFTQPETRLIRDLLDDLDRNDVTVRAFLDFHSTNRNVFYTQNDDFPTEPSGFTPQWLNAAGERITGYEFDNDENPVSEQANSKNYMYRRYGVPTATYEVGDETDRASTAKAATIFAEEWMRLLLEHR